MRKRKTSLLLLLALLAAALFGLAVIGPDEDPPEITAAAGARANETGPAPALELVSAPSGAGRAHAPVAASERLDDGATRANLMGAVPVRGQLVDANTLEPLPHYLLGLRPAGAGREGTSTVRSDEAGFFQTDVPFAAGTVEARPKDGIPPHKWRDWVPFEHAPIAAGEPPPLFGVRVGPTYEVRVVAPAGVEPGVLGADLAWEDTGKKGPVSRSVPRAKLPDDRRFVLLDTSTGFEVHLERREVEAPLARLDLPPPFAELTRVLGDRVRFPMPLRVVAKSLPESNRGRWSLRVFSLSGMWRGEAEVESIHGSDHPPLIVRLEPRGELSISVTNLAGERLKDVEIRLEPELETLAEESSDTLRLNKTARFGGLAPGLYQLTASAPDHIPKEMAVEVGGADSREVRVILTPYVQGGVSGEVHSESGAFRRPVRMVLDPIGSESEFRRRQHYARVAWREQEGRWVGGFHFDDVPPGSYRLNPIAGSFDDWLPPSMTVQAPMEELVFECLDGGARADLYVRAHDAESRAPLDKFRVSVSSRVGRRQISYGREQQPLRSVPASSNTALRVADGFPLDATITVITDASGYEPTEVDLSAFVATELDGLPVWLADVALDLRDP